VQDALRSVGEGRWASLQRMTQAEAVETCKQNNREHPERATHAWLSRRNTYGEWSVVKVPKPAGAVDPLKATIEAKPKPPQADDPRTGLPRLVPPYGAG
jgi:hypothetical protein